MKQTEHHGPSTDTAGVVARPPLLFLGALLLASIANHVLPLPFPHPRASWAHGFSATIAGLLILSGSTLVIAAIRNFSAADTPVPTNEPTRALVTSGVHAWTRNPIYLGFFLAYLGLAPAVSSTWALILILPLVLVIRYGVVAREEAYLEQRFGQAYRIYKAQVRRWV
jgi:protein-S-isoprenylcysteine O-methyltransferase Ste14